MSSPARALTWWPGTVQLACTVPVWSRDARSRVNLSRRGRGPGALPSRSVRAPLASRTARTGSPTIPAGGYGCARRERCLPVGPRCRCRRPCAVGLRQGSCSPWLAGPGIRHPLTLRPGPGLEANRSFNFSYLNDDNPNILYISSSQRAQERAVQRLELGLVAAPGANVIADRQTAGPAPRGPSRARGPARYLGRNDTVVTFLSPSPPSPTPEPVNLASASMLPLNPCPANWIAAMRLPDSVITELPEIV